MVQNGYAMTLTIKDSPERNSPGKQRVGSQNSANQPSESPRSNPVCFEVNVTIRSLPTEAGGLSKPIREDVRTVIVFDNGAVLRCAENLPVGLSVILSNSNGRDVVCKVVGGQTLPSIKGYVEVQFMESVSDFWNIHLDANPVSAVPTPASPLAFQEAPLDTPSPSTALPPAAHARAAASLELQAARESEPAGGAPTFDDIEGLALEPAPASARASKPARPGPEMKAKETSGYSHTEVARSTSLGNWNSVDSDTSPDKYSGSPASRELSPGAASNSASAPARDFLSKGLMAYEKPVEAPGVLTGRKPLIAGAAVLALAGVGAVAFFMHRQSTPMPVANTVTATQPSAEVSTAANSAAAPVATPMGAPAPLATQSQLAAQPVAVESAQPATVVTATPAVLTSPLPGDTRNDSRGTRRAEKIAIPAKQPEPRHAAIPNLKMTSPSAPNQKLADLSAGSAPMTDVSATEAVGIATSAGLLTAAGRTSNPPTPPPSEPVPAPVARTVRDPQLISSSRLVYPPGARQSGIQGTVTISASIDESGNVVSAKAISGPLLLREAAAESVRQWKYSPSLVGGKPAPAQVTVNVE